MKILFVSSILAYGGASKLLNDLLPLFKNDGIECDLLVLHERSTKYADILRQKGIPVTFIPKDVKGHFARIKYIEKFILKGTYDMVHVNLFPMTYYCSVIKKFKIKTLPMVMTEHNTDNKRRHIGVLRPVEKNIYKSYDSIISISDQCQEQLLSWLKPKDKEKYSIITNGIFVDRYKDANPYDRKELFYGIKDNERLLCMVGRFSVQKNHEIMVKVMEKLGINYKILFVGEGTLMEEIKDSVKEKGLEDRIAFLGFRTDIPEIMHTADIVVIPSKWEGFGLVAAEAMACGTPIVASNVTGLAEVVGEAGILSDPNNVQEFIVAIKKLEDDEVYKKCKAAGIERCELFDIKRMCREYERAYNAVQIKK